MNFIIKSIFSLVILAAVALGSYNFGIQNQPVELEKPIKDKVISYIDSKRAKGEPINLTEKFGTNFSKMNLEGMNLSGVTLTDADLSYANLNLRVKYS